MEEVRDPRQPQKPTSDLAPSPADRLQDHGPRSLTNAELLAVAGDLDPDQALALLQASGGLARLRQTLTTEHLPFPGPAHTASRLRASLELSTRLARARLRPGKLLNRPSVVAKYLIARYSVPNQEVAGAVFLDHRLRHLADHELFRGTRRRCDISPEPFLRHALLLDAHAIIAFHTHPSGEVEASEEDIAFTKRLKEACEAAGFYLVDHLILGEAGKRTSLRQEEVL
ncbi:MAG: hypothetical protein K0U98_21345 [Deltaproteobacteria bacterium]|nr:hypothetical protein [Deltaproteobacteria bacterium]